MRVLVVEDSEKLRRALQYGLRKAGFVVDVTGDGEEGLWYAESNEYDVVVLDLMLPGLDGLSVLKRMRDGGRQTPVLLLTVKSDVPDRVAGLRAGADDYLTKPFAFDELVARVEALVRRQYGKKSTRLQVGGLILDTAARTASHGDKVIDLSPRDYRLLELLTLRQGEVVTRTEIEGHIYDDNSELFSNAVESGISNLRKKLEAAGLDPLIQTRRGMGYILQPPSR